MKLSWRTNLPNAPMLVLLPRRFHDETQTRVRYVSLIILSDR